MIIMDINRYVFMPEAYIDLKNGNELTRIYLVQKNLLV